MKGVFGVTSIILSGLYVKRKAAPDVALSLGSLDCEALRAEVHGMDARIIPVKIISRPYSGRTTEENPEAANWRPRAAAEWLMAG
jgi:hypothetical protein